MRDLNRIEPLLAKLGEAWKKDPDQRFGQFLVNFLGTYGSDPWYPEDDAWMIGIQAYIDGKNMYEAMDAYDEECCEREERLKQLREDLMLVEADRILGFPGRTIEEVDAELSRIFEEEE